MAAGKAQCGGVKGGGGGGGGDASVQRLNLMISEPRFALTVLVSSWSSLLFIIFHAQIENSKQT